MDFNYYLYGLIKQGLVVHSLTEEIPEGLAGQIMLSVKAYTNADFSVQLGKNINAESKKELRRATATVARRRVDIGLRERCMNSRRNGVQRIGVKWLPDPDLAPLVRLAWELRARGKGYAEIIRATAGRTTQPKIHGLHTSGIRVTSELRKSGDLEVPDHHEALITYELWEAVKRVEAAMPRQKWTGELLHPRRMSHPSLLSGLSYCIYCGSAMVLQTVPARPEEGKKEYRSYARGSRDRQRVYKECKGARRVNANKADMAVLVWS